MEQKIKPYKFTNFLFEQHTVSFRATGNNKHEDIYHLFKPVGDCCCSGLYAYISFHSDFSLNCLDNEDALLFSQRPETPCSYGKPEGYGRCHMFLPCGKNEECIGNICCRVIGKIYPLT